MASLSLSHINKTYPNGFQAVEDLISGETKDKEFIIFVDHPMWKIYKYFV